MTNIKTKLKAGAGRPRKEFTPGQVEAAAAYSLNFRQLAAILGVHRNTITNRMDEDPEYREAYERGKGKAEGEILQLLYDSARNGNVKAQIFLAQSILGLSSRETLRHEGEVSGKFVVELPAESPSLGAWESTFRPGAPVDIPGEDLAGERSE
jgi:hypothetical protein